MCIYTLIHKSKEIDRKEVIDAICMLEREDNSLENEIENCSSIIDQLFETGKNPKNKANRTFIAKKITNVMEERTALIKRVMFILYNIRMLSKLKETIDTKQVLSKISLINITHYFQDQEKLALYLNDVLNTKTKAEDILTNYDDIFVEVESMYRENTKIYEASSITEDGILAMFEESDAEQENLGNLKQEL